jgi:hypothetical protein
MPEVAVILLGGAAFLAAAMLVLFIGATLIGQEAFSRAFGAMVGMFSGMGIMLVLVVLGLCLCVCGACAVLMLFVPPV